MSKRNKCVSNQEIRHRAVFLYKQHFLPLFFFGGLVLFNLFSFLITGLLFVGGFFPETIFGSPDVFKNALPLLALYLIAFPFVPGFMRYAAFRDEQTSVGVSKVKNVGSPRKHTLSIWYYYRYNLPQTIALGILTPLVCFPPTYLLQQLTNTIIGILDDNTSDLAIWLISLPGNVLIDLCWCLLALFICLYTQSDNLPETLRKSWRLKKHLPRFLTFVVSTAWWAFLIVSTLYLFTSYYIPTVTVLLFLTIPAFYVFFLPWFLVCLSSYALKLTREVA